MLLTRQKELSTPTLRAVLCSFEPELFNYESYSIRGRRIEPIRFLPVELYDTARLQSFLTMLFLNRVPATLLLIWIFSRFRRHLSAALAQSAAIPSNFQMADSKGVIFFSYSPQFFGTSFAIYSFPRWGWCFLRWISENTHKI